MSQDERKQEEVLQKHDKESCLQSKKSTRKGLEQLEKKSLRGFENAPAISNVCQDPEL